MPDPVTIAAGLGASIVGLISWISTLPTEFKYIIFLGGLAVDGLIISGIFHQGVVGLALTTLFNFGFGIPITITSFQLFIVFAFLPLILFLLKNALSHQ